ncbi:hypothetical protein BT93_F1065 [Corymbia citriodora subsp. variegata]|nr:hypothetical protein BT93_F1065 [Corymbia citriodora subsp. variegata]
MPRGSDPFWKYVEVVENNKWRCIFCGNECAGGATRIKAHLAGVRGYGIKECERVDDRVRGEALIAIKGKSASDPCRVAGTSGEARETRSGGMSQTPFPRNCSPNLDDVLNSNQHTCGAQQPSCHWQTGSDAAAIQPQCHLVLSPGDVPLDEVDITWQYNQLQQSFDAEHRDEIALLCQQSSKDGSASLSPDINHLQQLFDQTVNFDIGNRQQHTRVSSSLQSDLFLNNSASDVLHESTGPTGSCESISHSAMFSMEGIPCLLNSLYQPQSAVPFPYPEEMQMNDQQTPARASSFQYDQLLDIGSANFLQDCSQPRITSVTSLDNIVLHSNEPLPSCNEECGAEARLFPLQDSVGIYSLIEVQPSGAPHIFEATNVDLQVPERGANMGPSSSRGTA